VGGAGIAAEDVEATGIRVGVAEAAGDETTGVVAAWAFAGGVTVVEVGVADVGDTSGPETMLNACSSHAIRCSRASRCLLRVMNWAKMRSSRIGVEAGLGRRCLGSGL